MVLSPAGARFQAFMIWLLNCNAKVEQSIRSFSFTIILIYSRRQSCPRFILWSWRLSFQWPRRTFVGRIVLVSICVRSSLQRALKSTKLELACRNGDSGSCDNARVPREYRCGGHRLSAVAILGARILLEKPMQAGLPKVCEIV